MPAGRPSEFYQEVIKQLREYFFIPYEQMDIIQETTGENGSTMFKLRGAKFPTIEGFCAKHGLTKQTLHKWIKENQELFDVYKQCKQVQYDMLISNTLNGSYKEGFAKFVAMNLYGMNEKSEQDHKSSDKSMTPVFNIVEKK